MGTTQCSLETVRRMKNDTATGLVMLPTYWKKLDRLAKNKFEEGHVHVLVKVAIEISQA